MCFREAVLAIGRGSPSSQAVIGELAASQPVAMAVQDKLWFLQKLPTLIRATSDNETPCPGYVFEEIAKMTHESVGSRQCLLEYLLNRLQSQSCHIKLKVLKILLYTCAHGSSEFLQELRRNASFIQEATVFSGPPDPLHGNGLYQKVRTTAQDLAGTLFADALSTPQTSLLHQRPLSHTGMGSKCHTGSNLQGFGYTQDSSGSGDLLMSTIQKVASVVSSAVLSSPDPSKSGKRDEDVYQPATAPSANVNHVVVPAHPVVMTHTRVSRQPGLAGGGWEESNSSHSSQRSSQENCGSGLTSRSSSDSHSGASKEAGDLTERVEGVHLSDCMQEVSLVNLVTQGSKVFLSREEVQHFVKECALLNCETVLELLNRALQDPSINVQMRSMSAISSLMCTDLLSHDHMFSATQPHLQRLSEGSLSPVANRATKILRQFEAMNRSKAPSDTLSIVDASPRQEGRNLFTDSLAFPGAEIILNPFGMALFSTDPLEQTRETNQTLSPLSVPSSSGDAGAEVVTAQQQSTDLELRPAPAVLRPANRVQLSSSVVSTQTGELEPKAGSARSMPISDPSCAKNAACVWAGVPSRTSLFDGMDIIDSPVKRLHHMEMRTTHSPAEARSTSPQTVPDLPVAKLDTNPSVSSVFSFLNN